MGFWDIVKKTTSKTLDYVSAPLSQPKVTLTKGWTAGASAVKSTRQSISAGKTSAWKPALTTIGSTAVVAGAVLAAAPAASTGAAGAVTRSVISKVAATTGKTLFGSVGRAASTTLAAGVLVSSPTVRKAAVNLPKNIFDTGKAVGTTIEKTTGGDKDKIANIAAKTLLIGTGAGAVALGASYIAPKVIGAFKKDSEKPLTSTAPAITPTETYVPPTQPESQLIAEKPVGVATTPTTQATTTLKKPYKRRRAKKSPSVRQTVRVNVINAPKTTGMSISNKRYIKQELLA